MRNRFDQQLEELNELLIEMGALCGSAVALDAKALELDDAALREQAVQTDMKIDKLEREIESLCLRLLLQRPAADLGRAEDDHRYGTHRRSGLGYRGDPDPPAAFGDLPAAAPAGDVPERRPHGDRQRGSLRQKGSGAGPQRDGTR